MLRIATSTGDEFESALHLIEENMAPVLSCHGLSCDRSWNRTNLEKRDNYSIFVDRHWVGFLSLETSDKRLFVHTLQLLPARQGNIYGLLVFRWLGEQAKEKSVNMLACKAVRDSAAASLYHRLGFSITAEDGALIELELSLDKLRPDRQPTLVGRLLPCETNNGDHH